MSKIPVLLLRGSRSRESALLIGLAVVLTARLLRKRQRQHTALYSGPAGGWGSAKGVGTALMGQRVPLSGARLLLHQNKPNGFACVSCAWAKPKSRALEFCENGAKATAWEVDSHRVTPTFFKDQ